MNKFYFLFLLISINTLVAEDRIFISPGLKFGYAFGEKGGFISGIEISFMEEPFSGKPDNTYGAVISFEHFINEYRLHIGAQINFSKYEGAWDYFGFEIGPTYIWNANDKNLGLSITPYFGGFIIPYYRVLFIPNKYIQNEVGTFIKFHLQIKGKPYFGT